MDSVDSADLQDLIGPVWRRKWLLLAILVVSTVGTYTASSQSAARYRSSTQVDVSSSPIAAIAAGNQADGSDRAVLDQATLLVSRPVTEAVLRELGLHDTPAGLVNTVSVSPVVGSNFITVSASRGSGAEAAAVANAYVQQYIRVSNARLTSDATAAIARIRRELARLGPTNSNLAQRQSLLQTIGQIQVAASRTAQAQTNPAVASGVPFTPKPKRDTAFGFAIALGLGLALVFALERFDRRIKNVGEVSKVYGLPLLSVIPHTLTPATVGDGHPTVPDLLREPFRSLRTNVQLASLDRPIKRIVVASAISGEGKSTVVRNLALTYREWGLNVVIIEADLRRPTLRASFGLEPGTNGLTAMLTGDMTLDDALIEVAFESASLDYLEKVRVDGAAEGRPRPGPTAESPRRLVLLPSGDTPPNPQAVLESAKTRQVIEQLSARFDVVLIDTPPLLAVSDAIPLLAQSDGVILVTRVGMTERPSAERAMASVLLDPSVRALGVVANDVAPQPGGGYGYGYGYGYGQGYD